MQTLQQRYADSPDITKTTIKKITLRIRIIAHTRQFIFGKKFSLYQLIRDLCVYSKLRFSKRFWIYIVNIPIFVNFGITISRKIPKWLRMIDLTENYSSIYLKLIKDFDPMLQFGPTLLIIFQNQSPYALIQGYTIIRILRVCLHSHLHFLYR